MLVMFVLNCINCWDEYFPSIFYISIPLSWCQYNKIVWFVIHTFERYLSSTPFFIRIVHGKANNAQKCFHIVTSVVNICTRNPVNIFPHAHAYTHHCQWHQQYTDAIMVDFFRLSLCKLDVIIVEMNWYCKLFSVSSSKFIVNIISI